MRRWIAALAITALVAAGCSAAGEAGEDRTVVASIYPLAFAARQISGPGWSVIDLTPPGTEAHDVELSLEDRAAIEDADIMLYLGDIGFQPQVERAVDEATGEVVRATEGLDLLEGHEEDEPVDPHVWLDPVTFAAMVDRAADGMSRADTDGADGYRSRAAGLVSDLEDLDGRYRGGLSGCRSDTIVVSHEAFGYLAARYGLEQVGLAGLEPEGEPTVAALEEAGATLRAGDARAVFYEAGNEARRIAETVAADAGVLALPLSTLESEPPTGDYLTVMDDNLASLRRGLGCP
jgi:zinc transport system substrate-binding protein